MNLRTCVTCAILGMTLVAATIDLNNLLNYENQPLPAYVNKDNTTPGNAITDEGATLGRVLFYDKNLSANNAISCANCHQQQFAFGDTAVQSKGLYGGFTGRHAMRLVNARFANEEHFFWDERAATLEQQTTMPVQDQVEMGFSGMNGQPDMDSLTRKLESIAYYQELFTFVYGDADVTENRIQRALAQFIRSMQSFDSKYDAGRALVGNDGAPFPNFTAQENQGKALFLAPPPNGGGCQGCHQAPEFDIDPNTLNNGVIGVAGDPNATDLTNTRAPSLRNVVGMNGASNGPLMHDGSLATLADVVNHYNVIPQNPANTNLDPRLAGPNAQGQNLQFSQAQKNALVAFLGTLTGTAIYTDERWSDPFDSLGNLQIIPVTATAVQEENTFSVSVFPNPVHDILYIRIAQGAYTVTVTATSGQQVMQEFSTGNLSVDISHVPAGIYTVNILDMITQKMHVEKIVKF